MKAFNITFCVLFILCAALQYNDPDPYVWVPIYLYGAWLCFEASRNKFYPRGYLAGMAVYLVYAAYLFFDKTGVLDWYQEHNAENIAQSMKATKPWVEETREFGGLLILIIALAIDWVWSARKLRT
ncbi:transmembrane 220 family protein [Hufsiella ginkgonis]|uniref:Transmembrane family 220, helix n=1 Tax=Hufsiella ginkgonis TaxID=2695274 RepID=A0A7K1XZX9_9SPHI|nr:transmembrane 220 family protein [Hufsiella ginkgonis]MXV16086.1 hypothetical protein [Hufsiella ginkgonis]